MYDVVDPPARKVQQIGSPPHAAASPLPLTYEWHRLAAEQFKGEFRSVVVQLRYMMVLLLVMLKGREPFIWMPRVERSSVTQVLGRKLEGWITNRWVSGVMAVIG